MYGTYNRHGTGTQLWRYNGVWSPVMSNGFGDTSNEGIDHLAEFNGQLYAGTWNWDNNTSQSNGGEIWRSSDGINWTQVVYAGFGDTENVEVFRFHTFNNQIYASTWRYDNNGTEIWRSSTGDADSWAKVSSNGFGDANNTGGISFVDFNGYLYSGTSNDTTGGEVWRSSDGTTWAQVNADGFGDVDNTTITALASFENYLYATTHHLSGAGAEIWRCQICNGSDWVNVVDNGFGDSNVRDMPGLEVYNGELYTVVGDYGMGLDIWRTGNGTTWEQVAFDGFGDSNNSKPYWDNSIAVFDDALYIGTRNDANGGEVWSVDNDSVVFAKDIVALSYQDMPSTTNATSASGDPVSPAECGIAGSGQATVWYEYNPVGDSAIAIDTEGADYDTFIAIWEGTDTNNLTFVACNDDTGGTKQSAVAIHVTGGKTYYIEIGQP